LEFRSDYIERRSTTTRYETGESWAILSPIEQSIKLKIEAVGVPLKDWDIQINYGIKTGFNDAFIISGAKREELIAADPKSAEIIRPILRGKDIKRYRYDFSDLWLINTHNGIRERRIPPVDVNDYPAIKAYLDKFYAPLTKRLDKGVTPYNLRNCAYTDDFSKQKIVWGEISDKTKFAIDLNGEYVPEATAFFMIGDSLKYLLCFLNSRLSEYYFAKIGTTTGVGTVRWKKYKIESFPIPQIANIDEFINDIDIIINSTRMSHDITNIEMRLNNLIYKIFNFTDDEIKIIES
jgi:hypothetical protein